MPFLIQAITISIISFFSFYPSFHLGLFGDDWLMLWTYMHYLGPQAPSGLTNYFTFFLSGYGPYEITMGLLYRFFGLNSSIYYLFSYSFRLLAAFAIWPLIFYLTRSKLAAFYGSLFLSVTIIGLETTNWVFNMTSYLAITFLSLFLYFFIKSREELNFRLFIFSCIFFYLAHVFASVRMTGLLPFIIILEIYLNFRIKNTKLTLIRLLILIIVFIIISTTGAVIETQGKLISGAAGVISSGINTSLTLLRQGHIMFLFNPLITIGRLVIPEVYLSSIPNHQNLFLPLGLLVLVLALFLSQRNKKTKLSIAFFVSFCWIILSFWFSWFRDPTALYPIDYRYFIPTAVGFAIFWSSIIGLGKNYKTRVNVFLLMIIILTLHLIATRNYLTDAVINSHGSEAINKMWLNFPTIKNSYILNHPFIFYFQTVPSKQTLLYYSVEFGLPYHLAFINKIYDSNAYYKMPVAIEDWKEVISAITDGKSLVSRQFPEKPIPIDNVYAFYLDENNNLIDTTKETREKLTSEVNKLPAIKD